MGKKESFWIIITILMTIIFILSVAFFYWFHFHSNDLSSSSEKWGQFGDYLGGVLNPGLSFISIILICITVIITSRQSSLQSFESLLFELLKLHKDNLSEIKVSYEDSIYKGKECFSWYNKEIKWNYFHEVKQDLDPKIRLSNAIEFIYVNTNNFIQLGHYFRNLYHIFKHIDEASFLNEKEKRRYAKLIRAQLSSLESDALFYNGILEKGRAFKVYIEKYSLLQEMSLVSDFTDDFPELSIYNFYKEEAIKDKY